MSENRVAVVHQDELAAIKDGRDRDLPIFVSSDGQEYMWIVAVSDHQAKLAMVDYIWPMRKLTKRARDERYTKLLEKYFVTVPPEPDEEAELEDVSVQS